MNNLDVEVLKRMIKVLQEAPAKAEAKAKDVYVNCPDVDRLAYECGLLSGTLKAAADVLESMLEVSSKAK